MSNSRLHPLFRAAFDDLRDGNAALARAAATLDIKERLEAHMRKILDTLASSHRAAREELRDGMAALERANGVTMPKRQYVRDIRLTFEQPPIPLRQFDWRACYDGDDEEPSRHGWGRTAEEALADLKRVDREWDESLETEEERLLGEYP